MSCRWWVVVLNLRRIISFHLVVNFSAEFPIKSLSLWSIVHLCSKNPFLKMENEFLHIVAEAPNVKASLKAVHLALKTDACGTLRERCCTSELVTLSVLSTSTGGAKASIEDATTFWHPFIFSRCNKCSMLIHTLQSHLHTARSVCAYWRSDNNVRPAGHGSTIAQWQLYFPTPYAIQSLVPKARTAT